MTAEYQLVQYDDFDLEQVVGIARAIRPDGFDSVTDLRDWLTGHRRAGRSCIHWLAFVDGEIVGSAYTSQSPWFEDTMIVINVKVHPDHQMKGYGRELLDRAEATAGDWGADRLIGWVPETRPRAVRFAERAGFREIDRDFESTLQLDRCDLDELEGMVARVAGDGIRIVSVSALSAERPGWQRDLYRIFNAVEVDVPNEYPVQALPFEDFDTLSLGRRLLGDGFFVAMDGDDLVGLSEPQRVEDDPTVLAQNLTGVRSEYRGRGIAKALKAKCALWAVEAGYASIRTNNAQSNAPMLSVNDRIGFERDHATLEFLKTL